MQEWTKASPFQNPIFVISFGILLALYPEKKEEDKDETSEWEI